MDRGRFIFAFFVLLGSVVALVEGAPTAGGHPLSMSHMLSNLFIEPQGPRHYRSTSPNTQEPEMEEVLQEATHSQPQNSHPPPSKELPEPERAPKKLSDSQNDFRAKQQPTPPRQNPVGGFPRPQFSFPNGDGGPPRPAFNGGAPPLRPPFPNIPPRFNPRPINGPLNKGFPQASPQNPSQPSAGTQQNNPMSMESSRLLPPPNPSLPPNSNILQAKQEEEENKGMIDGIANTESSQLSPTEPKMKDAKPEETDQKAFRLKEAPEFRFKQVLEFHFKEALVFRSKQALGGSSHSDLFHFFRGSTARSSILFKSTIKALCSSSNLSSSEFPPPPPPPLDLVNDFLIPPSATLGREQCIGVNGSMIGECSDPFDCAESGGKSVGPCPSGPSQVCCSFVSFCNFMTNVERAYLSSPNYPETVSNLGSCAFQLSPLKDVCQVRIDFLDFHLKPPQNGICEDENAFTIESNDPNAYIPVSKLCGTLSQGDIDPLSEDVPHLYVHFKSMDDDAFVSSEKSPPKRLRYPNKPENLLAFKIRVKDYKSSWNIRINQISCDGGARQESPFGCGQYFTGEEGRIMSLNHADGHYPSDLGLTTCIKFDPEACGIAYDFESGASIGDVPNGLFFGNDCPGDFLMFSGQKAGVCGSLASNSSLAFENDRGPLSLHFHSDSRFNSIKDKGYSLKYEHLYNCRNTEFFSYNHFGI
ncbi:Uncharacterized protein FKW44_010326 [Caligus rogercresseyi]|uniref:CUB domain-containing protein n=1 Tax=Caligus rogercresseyi TaxID=217165 RepID=A0A7T8K9G7_CALRO|nr:Uncharacterized protein FKW44_010326 [Caligus rogercresseyi]